MRWHLARTIASLSLAAVLATPALAKIDPTQCEAPPVITVVGVNSTGAPDPRGAFTVVVRGLSGLPATDEDVWLDFSQCPEVMLGVDAVVPGQTMDCATRTVHILTGIDGRATFVVPGCTGQQGGPGATGATLQVFASGYFITTARVAVLDQIRCDGMDAGDLSAWIADFLSGNPFARSDYDGDGTLSAGDLSLWTDAFFAAASSSGCSVICP